MSRRGVTLVVTGALLVALLVAAWLLPVPFVTMSPGPTADVLGTFDDEPVIEIAGRRTYDTGGRLELTTVAVTRPSQQLDLLTALSNWLDSDVAVVPRSYLYREDDTPEQVEQQNVLQMNQSQQQAIAAALRTLDIEIEDEALVVGGVVGDSPAVDELETGDVIVAVDGTEVTNPEEVVEAVRAHEPGETVRFDIRRRGESMEVGVETMPDAGRPDRPMVGIYPALGYEFPFEVSINIDENIGGPSAGLMFALAIVDKLTPGALTGGQDVAGTGTIDADGNVNRIGGIQQKVAGAQASGASVFLTPAGNCSAAVAAGVDDILLVEVSTLDDAVRELTALANGERDDVAMCSA